MHHTIAAGRSVAIARVRAAAPPPHVSWVALSTAIGGGATAAAADAADGSPIKPRASRKRAELRAAHTRACE